MWWKKRMRREVPEINATSTADMAFMLLVFFLLTTSMGSQKGFKRELPSQADSLQMQPLKVLSRNVLTVQLKSNGKIYCNQEEIQLTELKDRTKQFIENPLDRTDFPEKPKQKLPLVGMVEMLDQHVIVLHYEEDTSYKVYYETLNQLLEAYQELRDKLSYHFFHCSFEESSAEQQTVVLSCCPQRISESVSIKEK